MGTIYIANHTTATPTPSKGVRMATREDTSSSAYRGSSVLVLKHDGDDWLSGVTRANDRLEMHCALLILLCNENVEKDGITIACTGAKDHQDIPEPSVEALAHLSVALGWVEAGSERSRESNWNFESRFFRDRRDVNEHAIFDGLLPTVTSDKLVVLQRVW